MAAVTQSSVVVVGRDGTVLVIWVVKEEEVVLWFQGGKVGLDVNVLIDTGWLYCGGVTLYVSISTTLSLYNLMHAYLKQRIK